MNKEDYVSLEVAKLLKEKGYDEYADTIFHDNCYYDERYTRYGLDIFGGDYLLIPTLYEVQKWLREKYHIAINIYNVLSTNGVAWKWEINNIEKCKSVIDRSESFIGFDTYEEALNAGILEALKTI